MTYSYQRIRILNEQLIAIRKTIKNSKFQSVFMCDALPLNDAIWQNETGIVNLPAQHLRSQH